MNNLLYKFESYQIIKKCFEVHNTLGKGFMEILYKDALEYEFDLANIPYKREVKYDVHYKDKKLNHPYYADFVVYDKIILEVKAVSVIREEFLTQTINYLKVSDNKLGLLVNFGEPSLTFKRVVF
jgi:GxxExxY protein